MCKLDIRNCDYDRGRIDALYEVETQIQDELNRLARLRENWRLLNGLSRAVDIVRDLNGLPPVLNRFREPKSHTFTAESLLRSSEEEET